LITGDIVSAVSELSNVDTGLLHVFIQHTSASVCISENADGDVPLDLEMAFNSLAPEIMPYRHTVEGPDDMPAHVKSCLLGNSVWVPVHAGRLLLGTWQGIFLCEHRNRAPSRSLVLTLSGQPR
jgi:secondary thiamine-phosphate synthase enzyme